MNRRSILQLVAALAGASLLPNTENPLASSNRLSELFADPILLRALGQRCKQYLTTDIDSLLQIAGLLDTEAATAELVEHFAAKRADDFRHGRLITVDGWLMAKAECALCALVARS